MSVRILSFNAIHSVIKNIFHKGPVADNGACQKWLILFLDIFQRNFRRWAWKNNNLKVSLKSPKKYTVESQYCPKFVLRQMYRKTWFYMYTTKLFISAKHVPKLEIFAIGPVVFAPGTQTCAPELKKLTIYTCRAYGHISNYKIFVFLCYAYARHSVSWGLSYIEYHAITYVCIYQYYACVSTGR
jgi:hypothetical protein